MQMPFEIQLDLAAVVESPRTYYTEPSKPEGGWTIDALGSSQIFFSTQNLERT